MDEKSKDPPGAASEHRSLNHRLRGQSADIARLAGPVIVARSGMMVLALTDTIMVGRFSAQELAYQSIGIAPIMALMVTGFGLIQGTQVLTAFHMGAGIYQECGVVWRRSILYAMSLGLLGFVITLFGEPFFRLVGQSTDIATNGADVLIVIGLSLPPMLIYVTSSYFLEGIRRPKPAMFMMIAANVVNVFLDWVLIYGKFGVPAMGALGSAWATTGVRIFMAAMIVIYIWRLRDHARFAIRARAPRGWRLWALQRRIGYGAGASTAVESSAFTAMNLFAGLISAAALGAFAIALNILSVAFMVALGLGAATAISVGNAHGRKDIADMSLAGWTGLGLTLVILSAIGLFLHLAAPLLAAAYTADQQLLAVTVPLVAFLLFVLPVDGGQVVIAHALRGRGETWVPAVLHMIAYLFFMMPLGWLFAIRLERGVIGLFEAIFLASILSVALLSLRFWQLSIRDRRQIPNR